MSLATQLAQVAVGAVAERLVEEVIGLLDNEITDEETKLVTEFVRKIRTAEAADRAELLRRVALEIGYERLAELSMDAALKASKAARKL